MPPDHWRKAPPSQGAPSPDELENNDDHQDIFKHHQASPSGSKHQVTTQSMVMEDDDILSGEDDGPRPHKKARYDSASGAKTNGNGNSSSNANGNSNANADDTEGPACQSCRRKKAKCSRKQPCSACVRYSVDCVYDDRRTKPGLRTGAVENLSQRVAALEHMFLGQGVLWQQVFSHLHLPVPPGVANASASDGSSPSLQQSASNLKSALSDLADAQPADSQWPPPPPPSQQQQRPDDNTRRRVTAAFPEDGAPLPPDDLLDALVEIYFFHMHIWIPMLHVHDFRARMGNPTERPRLRTIFHAIVSSCARFSDDPRLGDREAKARLAKQSRQAVILESMEAFSVESLQALIICAFDTIGSGRGPSSWSIVGSMTRTVEQLQLSVEDEDQPPTAKVLIKRMAFLPPCRNWGEHEERRRVFWNTFLLDRFCSIATGWNFSLTSADVRRRLPCEGALWEAGEPLQTPTPYFGVADQSGGSTGALPTARPEGEAQDSIGGFAYCIEATESLSLVTSFFLQQGVDVTRPQEVQMWLLKFKQLDLRLVQWKIFLPEQWREACALNSDGVLDPNLTLAHISHNTAVVLLHQGIAYPLPEWQAAGLRLPSGSSSETCLAAATEVAIIADRFLQGSTYLTAPQFAFSLFICGRCLLAHAIYHSLPLSAAFDSLVHSLVEMSRRWNGPDDASDNLASKFARRLVRAREQGHGALDLRQAVYSDDPGVPPAESHPVPMYAPEYAAAEPDQDTSPDSMSLAFPPLPVSFYQQSSRGPTAAPSPGMAFDPTHANDFEDLSTFLDFSFLPNQRISMYSGQPEK